MRALWIYPTALLWSASFVMVGWASPCRCSPPLWSGMLDVALALALVVAASMFWLRARGRIDDRSRQLAYDAMTIALPLGCVGFWMARLEVDWNVLLPGLAWRLFITMQALPAVLSQRDQRRV